MGEPAAKAAFKSAFRASSLGELIMRYRSAGAQSPGRAASSSGVPGFGVSAGFGSSGTGGLALGTRTGGLVCGVDGLA